MITLLLSDMQETERTLEELKLDYKAKLESCDNALVDLELCLMDVDEHKDHLKENLNNFKKMME